MFVAPVRDPPPAPVFPSFPDVVQQGLAASDIQIVPLCPKDDTPPPAAPDAPLAVVSDAPPARPVIPERRFAGRPALIALPPAGKTAIRKRRIPHEDVTSLVGRHARAALTTYVAHQHDGRPPFDKVQVSFRVDRRCVVRLLGLRISGALHDKVTADIETTIRRGLRVSVPRTQCEGMTRSVRGSFSLVGVPTDAER